MAKTQNSFNSEEEFTLVQFNSVSKNPSDSGPEGNRAESAGVYQLERLSNKATPPIEADKPFCEKQETVPDFFVLPSNVWTSIQSDEAFAAEIKKVIDSEVEKRVDQAVATRLAEIEPINLQKQKEKENEAFETGLKKAEEQIEQTKVDLLRQAEAVQSELRKCISDIIQEKQRLLEQHQKDWINALSLLMRKFLVKNAGRVEAGIGHWLQTQVSNFSATEKLLIFVPESQFQRMEKLRLSLGEREFQFFSDNRLRDGEFRVEGKTGGIFFSAEEEMKKLEDLLCELTGVEELESA